MTTVVETVILTSGTTWLVPNTWNSSNNTVSCIGGGGGARLGGGGGGARVINTNVSLTPGANISYTIGAGGSRGTTPTAGGNTTFNSSAMIAVGGGPASSANLNGGFGGTAASSTGTTKYSGGNGGAASLGADGGGGGAGGTTANGSSGSAGSGETGGNGGAGGNTGGGAGGIGVNQGTGGSGFPGFDTGISSASYGSNYSGGGGAGGGSTTDKSGTTYYNGGSGGLFGGGGGGGGPGGQGDGAQGGIIIEWTWQTTLPAANQAIQSSAINTVLRRTFNNQINYNETIVRDLANVVTSNTQIKASDFHDKNQNPTFVTNSLVQFGAGTTTLNLPGSIQVGDLVIFTGIFGLNRRPDVITPGWVFTGGNSVAADTSLGYQTGAFYRVFQTGDTSIQVVNPGAGFAGIFTVFRGASRAIARGKVDNATGTTLTFSGVTKSNISKRLFTVVFDRDPSTNATAPSGWTEHTRRGATNYAIESASIRSISYTNGTNIGWTNFVNGFRQIGILLELE